MSVSDSISQLKFGLGREQELSHPQKRPSIKPVPFCTACFQFTQTRSRKSESTSRVNPEDTYWMEQAGISPFTAWNKACGEGEHSELFCRTQISPSRTSLVYLNNHLSRLGGSSAWNNYQWIILFHCFFCLAWWIEPIQEVSQDLLFYTFKFEILILIQQYLPECQKL